MTIPTISNSQTDFAAYIPVVNRFDLLAQAVLSIPDLHDDLTIIDNSPNRTILSTDTNSCSSITLPPSTRIFRSSIPLTYTQSLNWALADCICRNRHFLINVHSDAVISNPAAANQLLSQVRQWHQEGRRWGIAWTHYDILAVFNPVAVRDVGGWDTTFSAYFCDNDMTRRLTIAGWECLNTGIEGVDHVGSATINSDHRLQFLNAQTFGLYRQYYVQKWGGGPGEEQFEFPFNRPDLFK